MVIECMKDLSVAQWDILDVGLFLSDERNLEVFSVGWLGASLAIET